MSAPSAVDARRARLRRRDLDLPGLPAGEEPRRRRAAGAGHDRARAVLAVTQTPSPARPSTRSEPAVDAHLAGAEHLDDVGRAVVPDLVAAAHPRHPRIGVERIELAGRGVSDGRGSRAAGGGGVPRGGGERLGRQRSAARRGAASSRSMNPVSSRPARNASSASSAARNGRLVCTPRISKRASASRVAGDGLVAGLAPDDQLGEQRVVVHRDLAALGHAGVDADARARRLAIEQQRPGLRQEARAPGPRRRRGTRWRGRAASARPARHGSGSPAATASCACTRSTPTTHSVIGMLDLQPGVHLEEVEPRVVAVALEQELDGAGVADSRPRAAAATAAAPIRARSAGVSAGHGRLLDHLLVPPLHRALALEQVHERCRGGRRRPAPRRGAGRSTSRST